jgi:CTP:molybdopterin cytidylyltransferase MocA
MGAPKALLKLGGESFLDRLIGVFAASCRPVIVVLGRNADFIRAALLRADQAVIVTNPAPERGMLSSLQCGLERVPREVEAILFTPVDYPGIAPSTVAMLTRSEAAIAIPVYGGVHGHPVRISRAIAAEILALPDGAQAREVIHRHRDKTEMAPAADPGVAQDVDTPEAYEALLATWQPRL